MNQLVTVVTLTYNRFDKIYNAISSVMCQDYPAIEYIISDDGSERFPKEEISDYINQIKQSNLIRFKLITHEENRGTVKNLNDAYHHAEGDIIIPVSADDAFLDSSAISRIVNVFNETKCEVLMIGRALYNSEGKFVRNIPSKKEAYILNTLRTNKDQYQRFVTGRFYGAYSGCVLSMTRAFIDSWGYFDEKYKLWEDGPFFAQYLWKHYMQCAFDIIGIRYNDGGVSSGKKHPLLLKDDEMFRKTDRVAHLDGLTWIQREIIKYDVMRTEDSSPKGRMRAVFFHLFGFLAIKAYRVSLRLLKD